MTDYVMLVITASSEEESNNIITVLLNKHLIACGNISSKVSSTYWWKGNLEKANEFVITAKTRLSLFKKVTEEVINIHSYEVPEILALPILKGNPEYLDWLGSEIAVDS